MNHQLGDLPGHLFPGLAFTLWAAIWAVALLRRGGEAASNPWSSRPDPRIGADPAAAFAWEAWAKIAVPLAELAFEARWLTWPMTDASATIYAHITCDVAVIISGITDLLVARRRLPPGSDRLALALAFLVPALLFLAHGQHGPLAATSHLIFGLLLLATGGLVALELTRPAPLVRWLRIYTTALAGTWFAHTGWLLYLSGYDQMNEAITPRVYLQFSWYALGVAALLATTIGAAAARTRSPIDAGR